MRRKRQPLPERAARVLKSLRHLRGLSIEERSVHALGIGATPEERWELFEGFVRSAGHWRPLRRKGSGAS
jgi:hypothetical protein